MRRCCERSGTVEQTQGFVSFSFVLAQLLSGTDRIDPVSEVAIDIGGLELNFLWLGIFGWYK